MGMSNLSAVPRVQGLWPFANTHNTHTQTHKNTHTHAHMHIHTHICTYTHTHIHINTHIKAKLDRDKWVLMHSLAKVWRQSKSMYSLAEGTKSHVLTRALTSKNHWIWHASECTHLPKPLYQCINACTHLPKVLKVGILSCLKALNLAMLICQGY